MNSKYIKAVLSAHFRWKKGYKFIATECGMYNSDFLAITSTNLIEIEIKTSKSDLNNDFKKPKHAIYANGRADWVPNQFYFAVPESLAEYALAKCVDKKYGVCVIYEPEGRARRSLHRNIDIPLEQVRKPVLESYEDVCFYEPVPSRGNPNILVHEFTYHSPLPWEDRIKVVKRAQKLTTRPPKNKVRFAMIARLISEMVNLRIQEQLAKK